MAGGCTDPSPQPRFAAQALKGRGRIFRQPCDEPILEAWRQGFQRGAAECLRRRGRGLLAQHDAQRVAGDQRVEHRGVVCRPPSDRTAAAGGHGQTEHPSAQRCEELVRRRVGQQPALVQQQHTATACGLVQIGGGPDYGHAFGTAFLPHRSNDRPEFAAR